MQEPGLLKSYSNAGKCHPELESMTTQPPHIEDLAVLPGEQQFGMAMEETWQHMQPCQKASDFLLSS